MQAIANETREQRTEATLRNLSMLPGAEQRRGAQRFAVELDMSIRSDHNFYSGLVQNLSESGVFVATHALRPVGTVVEFSITLRETQKVVTGKGEVRWSRDYNESSDAPPGMGIGFVELAPGCAEAIWEFVSGREAIYYE